MKSFNLLTLINHKESCHIGSRKMNNLTRQSEMKWASLVGSKLETMNI